MIQMRCSRGHAPHAAANSLRNRETVTLNSCGHWRPHVSGATRLKGKGSIRWVIGSEDNIALTWRQWACLLSNHVVCKRPFTKRSRGKEKDPKHAGSTHCGSTSFNIQYIYSCLEQDSGQVNTKSETAIIFNICPTYLYRAHPNLMFLNDN